MRAQMLVQLSFVYFLGMLAMCPIVYYLGQNQGNEFEWHTMMNTLFSTGLVFIAYLLSRTSYFAIAGWLLVGSIFSGIWFFAFSAPAVASYGLVFLSVCFLISSLTQSFLESLCLVIVSLLMQTVFTIDHYQSSTFHIIILVYNAISSGMILTFQKTRQSTQSKLEEERARAITSAKMSDLGDLAGSIAHEINNPLSIINGFVFQIIKYVSQKNQKIEAKVVIDYSEKIRQMSLKIAKIISDLRTLTRDARHDPFKEEKLSFIFQEVEELCRRKLQKTQTEFSFPGEIKETLECRSVQIVQALVNLVQNSIEAMEGLDGKWVRIEVKDCDDNFELSVIDAGRGIPKGIASQVMEPFFTTKKGEGAGLGLSASKEIIQAHRGNLWIDFTSTNTKVTLILPKVQVISEEKSA